MNKVKPARAFGLTGLTAVLVCYLFIATNTCAAASYSYLAESMVPAEMAGTWLSVSADHADLLEAMGVQDAQKKFSKPNAVKLILKRLPCGWKVTTIVGHLIRDVSFPLGIEIDADWLNGKTMKSILYEQGEALVEMEKEQHGTLTMVRFIENSNLVTRITYNEAVATIVFKRVTSG